MLVLATVAGLLLWAYNANTNSLIHLYVIGVFTAFTLSQAGMVRYWLRTRDKQWRVRAAINAVGATATGLVTLIVVYTKFAEGAWIVTVAIPVLVLGMLGVKRHYERFGRRLRAGTDAVAAASQPRNTTLLLVESLDDATAEAAWFAREISTNGFRALHVPTRSTDPGIRPRWFRLGGDLPQLEVLDATDGAADAMLEQVWRLPRGEADFVTVVIPEQFQSRSLLDQARRPLELALKLRLLAEPGVVVADVPVLPGANRPRPERIVARVLVPQVNATSMRAINYVRALGVEDAKAVHFAFSADDAAEIRRAWALHGPALPLEVIEAPYRDLGLPLLGYLRDLTADEQTAVLLVMPEIVTRGWRRLLHNQRALYIKRLVLLEPGVILASVPYQLL
jgi:hypothetical protein